jgi:hypothetical protein
MMKVKTTGPMAAIMQLPRKAADFLIASKDFFLDRVAVQQLLLLY